MNQKNTEQNWRLIKKLSKKFQRRLILDLLTSCSMLQYCKFQSRQRNFLQILTSFIFPPFVYTWAHYTNILNHENNSKAIKSKYFSSTQLRHYFDVYLIYISNIMSFYDRLVKHHGLSGFAGLFLSALTAHSFSLISSGFNNLFFKAWDKFRMVS